MDRKYKFGALAIVAVLPLLIAAQGGFPSRPTFQQVTVGTGGAVLTNSGTSLLVNGVVPWPTTQITTGCTATSSLPVGSTVIARKAADQSKTSTTSRTGDNDLCLILPTGGRFALDGVIRASAGTTEQLGLEMMTVSPGSTVITANWSCFGGGSTNQGVLTGTGVTLQVDARLGCAIALHGEVDTTSSGLVNVGWAQAVSGGNSTQIWRGSWLRVTRLE